MQFELKEGFISPYAGMSFFQKDAYWNLTPYNQIEIEVELQNTKNLELTLATYQNGVTKENQPLTFRHNVMEIPILENVTICKLPLERVQIAQWWLEKYKLRSTELGPVNWERTASLSLVAKIRLDSTKPQSLKINKVLFEKDLTAFYWISIVLLLIWYTGVGFYYRSSFLDIGTLKKKESRNAAETKRAMKEEDALLLDYLAKHYANPDLTLGKMSEVLKVPEKTISGAIKNNFDKSFKEHLNSIRLAEAKRMLRMEDKNVSEIAYQVGFSSPNHFNRTFKNVEGCTPTEFRSQSI